VVVRVIVSRFKIKAWRWMIWTFFSFDWDFHPSVFASCAGLHGWDVERAFAEALIKCAAEDELFIVTIREVACPRDGAHTFRLWAAVQCVLVLIWGDNC
jgi:hypothetical protein